MGIELNRVIASQKGATQDGNRRCGMLETEPVVMIMTAKGDPDW